jgi:hypothetical protein
MRVLPLALLLIGCAPAQYLYQFDLTDPGAVNYKDFRRPDVIEDGDVRVEIRVDPTEFKAIALEITNKTETELAVNWGGIFVVDPMHQQTQLGSTNPERVIMPTAKIITQLTPFSLPDIGPAAKMYDGTDFEFVVPMIVRGSPREYRYHLHVTLKKL